MAEPPDDGISGIYPQAPIVIGPRAVEPGWIDYNGHMNVAYYLLAFDQALDAFLDDWLGLGPAHVRRAGQGPYALQTHLHFLGELMEGEEFLVGIRMVDCDAKRMHLFCEMTHAGHGGLSATMEQVIMNVDLTARKSAPYPDWAQARLEAMRRAHAGLERPAQLGAPIGLRRRDRDPDLA